MCIKTLLKSTRLQQFRMAINKRNICILKYFSFQIAKTKVACALKSPTRQVLDGENCHSDAHSVKMAEKSTWSAFCVDGSIDNDSPLMLKKHELQ